MSFEVSPETLLFQAEQEIAKQEGLILEQEARSLTLQNSLVRIREMIAAATNPLSVKSSLRPHELKILSLLSEPQDEIKRIQETITRVEESITIINLEIQTREIKEAEIAKARRLELESLVTAAVTAAAQIRAAEEQAKPEVIPIAAAPIIEPIPQEAPQVLDPVTREIVLDPQIQLPEINKQHVGIAVAAVAIGSRFI